jgi:uncharacterized membrane protein YphA (DoxX/SURF4 family)
MTINLTSIGLWALRILAAVIMLQTLFFKFSGAEESIYIFSTLGMEPWGRIGTGTLELIASVLILFPKTTWIGALLAIGLMSGAIWFHLTFHLCPACFYFQRHIAFCLQERHCRIY